MYGAQILVHPSLCDEVACCDLSFVCVDSYSHVCSLHRNTQMLVIRFI